LATKSDGKQIRVWTGPDSDLPTRFNAGPPAYRDGVGSDTEHTTDIEMNAKRQAIRMEAVCSGSAPLVTMMQPTHLRNGDDVSSVWRLDRSGLRAVFLQRQMGAAAMIIVREAFEVPA
jgi:hypothetical protein